jgi:hypothetical protein
MGCTAVVGANGQPPGADGAVKQGASTLRKVKRGSSGGRWGPLGLGVLVVVGSVVVGGAVGAGAPVAAGGVAARAGGVARAGAWWRFAHRVVDGDVSASGFELAVPDAGPDTEYCQSQRGWWMRGGWLRNALASDGDVTTTPAASEAVHRMVRAMIRVMRAQAGPVPCIGAARERLRTPSGGTASPGAG